MSDLYGDNVPEEKVGKQNPVEENRGTAENGPTEYHSFERRMDRNPSVEETPSKTESEHITYSWVSPKLRNPQGQESENNSGERFSNPEQQRSENLFRERSTAGEWRSAGTEGRGPVRRETSTGESVRDTERKAPGREKRKVNKTPSVKKKKGTGKKWLTTIAMAVVFGLVAGLVFTGVSFAGRKLTGMSEQPDQRTEVASSDDQTDDEEMMEEEMIQVPDVPAGGTVADVAAQCMPSLVTISTISVEEMRSFFGQTKQYEVEGAGTGVIVGQNETEILIATNNHVVEGAKSLSVGFIDETAVAGAVKGYDSDTDLAVVAVRLEDIDEGTMEQIKICEMGDSDELVLGEQVVAIGNALGYGQSVTSGYVSAFNRELNLTDNSGRAFSSTGLIQTDASINSGNSGGALLNMRGELIGINEAKSSGSSSSASVDNIGFAIPISKAEPILKNLMTMVTRDKVEEDQAAYIGITCADVNQESARMYNMPTGVCLTSIFEGSPAEEAGLKKGDILTSFDGRDVNSYQELVDILQYYPAGETVEVVVQRSDEGEYSERVIALTLGSAADMPEVED